MKYILPSIALGLMPLSLNAQEVAQQDPVAVATPEQDLDCAIYITLVGVRAQGKQQTGVVAGMTYFIGRYEAASGQDVSAAASERLKLATLEEIVAQSDDCLARMTAMGETVQSLGEAFKGLQDELNKPEDSSE